MVDEAKIKHILEGLHLGGWQYHPCVGSTNDLALAWAKRGAPDWSLVLADTQTAGRGRAGRQWVTQPGSALAISLVLRPTPAEEAHIPRFTALAALGLVRTLAPRGLRAKLKWPNDVLLAGQKAAGVLVEADWQGERLDALVVGMGVNVTPESVPEPDLLRYPAISVSDIYGAPVDRWELLRDILLEIMALRRSLPEETFLEAWNNALAFRGDWVRFRQPGGVPQRVKILRVDSEGGLLYETREGHTESALAGEILMAYN